MMKLSKESLEQMIKAAYIEGVIVDDEAWEAEYDLDCHSDFAIDIMYRFWNRSDCKKAIEGINND